MINSRALGIVGILFVVFLVLVLKLFTIQISKHEYYKLIAETQQNKPLPVRSERGLIKDVNGEVLSYSFNSVTFSVDKRMMTKVRIEVIADSFSVVMGKSKNYYKELIKNGKVTVELEKKVPMHQALRLKKVVVDGLKYEEDFSRIYPYGTTASHILGYVNNKEGFGVEGIEKYLNDELTGKDGYLVYEKDVLGRILSVDESISTQPVSGNNVVLTINKTYQKILEQELLNGLNKYEGKSAVGIIMNPNTGEILALANLPDFDPASYNSYEAESRKNRAITDTYEPGSTMKSLIMAILEDNGKIDLDEIIDTENGVYSYKGAKIMDSHKSVSLSVRGVLEQSSNIGMTKLSERIPDDVLYKYLRDFGFSNRTSIELPSESAGTLKIPKSFSGISKAFMSFGYEMSVTPLQMTAAYAALINGGTLYKPFIVKSVEDYSGKKIKENTPSKIREVIKPKTSEVLKSIMVNVVEKGSGTAAQLEDVLVGGKTGTSQQLINKSYSSASHNSSFIGFFPAEKPNVLIYILVNSPSRGQYGGLVAAPIFHDIAKNLVESDMDLVPVKRKIERSNKLMEQLIADIKTAPKKTTRSYLNVADSNTEIKYSRNFEKGTTVPNLINQSMRDAIAKLNAMGIKWKVSGSGKVVWQSLEPGTQIDYSLICSIKCEPMLKKEKLMNIK